MDDSRLKSEDFTFEKQSEYLDTLYKELMENGWKMPDIDNADIYQMLRIMNDKKKSKTKRVGKNDSLIGAITGKDPRQSS
ncbi:MULTISPECIES: UPF0158 family protein [Staphylococcus]|uniref:UPF0158 family protein n=1 Tax=Staphylococcus TaxID=1279 RepID=UPI001D965753|nr:MULTISPECIES: UPF0158 family protein [Staphylococcus]HJG39670.1 UPF0158 family protein [Staphylococcus saprophyticus]